MSYINETLSNVLWFTGVNSVTDSAVQRVDNKFYSLFVVQSMRLFTTVYNTMEIEDEVMGKRFLHVMYK